MAELAAVIGLVSSVAGLVDLASKSAIGLRNAYQTMENAPITVQRLSKDLDAFHSATENLASTLRTFNEKGLVLQPQSYNHMDVAIQNCKNTVKIVFTTLKLEEVESSELRPEIRMSWRNKIRYLFDKGTLEDLLKDLAREKQTLNFSLQILMMQIMIADRYPILSGPVRRRTQEKLIDLDKELEVKVLDHPTADTAFAHNPSSGLEGKAGDKKLGVLEHTSAMSRPKAVTGEHQDADKVTDRVVNQEVEPSAAVTTTVSLRQTANKPEIMKSENPNSETTSEPQMHCGIATAPNLDEERGVAKDYDGTKSTFTHRPVSARMAELDEKKSIAEEEKPRHDPLKQFDFIMAVMEGDSDGVKHYIQENKGEIDIDETDPTHKRPPITFAVIFNHMDIANALIAAGANLDLADENGFAPLAHAQENVNLELMRILLDAGADPVPKVLPNWEIFGYGTYLTQALRRLQRDIAILLLNYDIDINNFSHVDGGKWAGANSPLQRACYSDSNLDLIRLLLEKGADPNAPSGASTPAITAVSCSQKEAFQILLDYGADPDLVHYGHTARGQCDSPGKEEMKKILFRHELNKSMNLK